MINRHKKLKIRSYHAECKDEKTRRWLLVSKVKCTVDGCSWKSDDVRRWTRGRVVGEAGGGGGEAYWATDQTIVPVLLMHGAASSL